MEALSIKRKTVIKAPYQFVLLIQNWNNALTCINIQKILPATFSL